MICLTSISPTHTNKDIQSVAVKSWMDLGMQVYSFNTLSECKMLSPLYPGVNFIETNRTMEHTFGKPYVSVSAIFDWCKGQKEVNYCLINSDIELRTNKQTVERIEMQLSGNKLVLANRVNYSATASGGRFLSGIDVFFLSKNNIKHFPQTLFCLGQCHFDYFIPYYSAKMGFEVIFLAQDIAFHKEHVTQYSKDNWTKTGHHFIYLLDLYQFSNQVGKASTHAYNYIYTTSKRIEI